MIVCFGLLLTACIVALVLFGLYKEVFLERLMSLLGVEMNQRSFVFLVVLVISAASVLELCVEMKFQTRSGELDFLRCMGFSKHDVNMVLMIPRMPSVVFFSLANSILLSVHFPLLYSVLFFILSVIVLSFGGLRASVYFNNKHALIGLNGNATFPRRIPIRSKWAANLRYEIFTPQYIIAFVIFSFLTIVLNIVSTPSIIIYHLLSWCSMWLSLNFMYEEKTDNLLKCFYRLRKADLARLHVTNATIFIAPLFLVVFACEIAAAPIYIASMNLIAAYLLFLCMHYSAAFLACFNQPGIKNKFIVPSFLGVVCINMVPLMCIPLLVIYIIVHRRDVAMPIRMEE
jgi:hypothetical protein